MGYYEGKDIVHVTAHGKVETDFVSASFNVGVKQHAKTGPEAKNLAAPVIEKIKHVIKERAKSGNIDTDRLRTTFKTDIKHDRHTGEPNGYECTYTLSFTAKNVSEATAIHDALTSIEGATAGSPVFNVNNADDLLDKAFQLAVDAAKAKFKRQCAALQINPQDYIITSWSPKSEEHHGKTLGLRDDDGPRPSLEPGKATLDVNVSVWFHRVPPTGTTRERDC